MGLPPFSRSSFDGSCSQRQPDMTKHRILKIYRKGKFVAFYIHYPNCTNYEGKKILVYNRAKTVLKQKILDPHFSDNKDHASPIARFEPTERGWKWACEFVDSLYSEGD